MVRACDAKKRALRRRKDDEMKVQGGGREERLGGDGWV